ncbi:hypothetical protein [Nonomuraea sp. NPDC049400]|uniref:hypothetical protein n=1 Tax=Nonomuraea sp. NPDC049400 TaxID=3364352 RepID=UPI0037BBE2B3
MALFRTTRRATNRFYSQLVGSPIIAGLVGASFGLVLSNLASSSGAGPPQWALVGLFLAAVFASAFVHNRLTRIEVHVSELVQAAHLLRLDEHSGGMDIVNGLVATSRHIRVIGRARQDQLSDPASKQTDYLAATEQALRLGSLSRYWRITGEELRPRFREHLVTLLKTSGEEGRVKIGIVDKFDTLVSYQVFDRVAAILGIETTPGPGVRDSTVVFLTYNAEIIDALISHFDSAWACVTPILKAEELERQTRAI